MEKECKIMEFLKIRNLEKYQHYSDRNMVWFKWYIDCLQDYHFTKLKNDTKWVFLGLICLACKMKNKIPFDIKWIKEKISNPDEDITEAIKSLLDSKMIASCYQNAIPIREDKIREDKIREDKNILCKVDKTQLNTKEPSFAFILKEIISFLNKKTNRHFRCDKSAETMIRARLNEKYTLEDFKLVIAFKCREWLKDDKMNKFLRPSTLFRSSHFGEYLALARQVVEQEENKFGKRDTEENRERS